MAEINSRFLETQSVSRTGKGGEQGPRFKRLRKKYADSEDESPEGDPGASDGSEDGDNEDFVDQRTTHGLESDDDGPEGELVPLLSFRWCYDPAADTEAATSPAYPTHEQGKARLALAAKLRELTTAYTACVEKAYEEGLIEFEDEEL